MDAEKLKAGILAAVREYLSSEESYDDDAQLRIDPATMKIDLADGEEADDESDPRDYYSVMDLVEMDADGKWTPDPDAIAAVAAEYQA